MGYEVPLLRHFLRAGLPGETLLPPSTSGNASIENWKEILERGLPFVKVSAVRSGSGDRRGVLAPRDMIPRSLKALCPSSSKPRAAQPERFVH
jgi:hypothetical protein